MYAIISRGYQSDATTIDTGIVDYLPDNSWGNNPGTGSVLSGYMILDRMGYYLDATTTQTGVIDYTHLEGYYKDVVTIDTGILDYLLDDIRYNIIIEQDRGWEFNWELITKLWDTIDNNWEV